MRSFIIYLNFVSLLAVCLFACNYHSSNPMLQQVDSLLEMKPDSALTILKNISVLEDLPEVDKAYYALLLAEATDKNKLPLLPCDSLLNFALDYYGDDDREKAVALMYKGRLLAQMNDEMSAIEHNLKALEVLQNYPQDLKCRRLIYSMLGVWYGDCELYDKALEIQNQALLYSFSAKDTAIAYHNIGYIYGMRDMQDSAITYQRKSVEYAMRSKEDAQDYRYFPDPDLVPIHISEEWLDTIREAQPEFKDEKMHRYKEEFGIPDYDINMITDSKKLADIFEETTALCNKPKKVSNWLITETMRILKEKNMDPEDITFSPKSLARIIELADEGAINSNVAKEIFEKIFDEDIDPDKYIEENGLKQVNDEGALKATVEKVIADNPQSVADYRAGKEKAIGFLVGQTMKAMQGKANPGMVNKLLKELL